jgi:catechol 1,2-dioxygenase
MLEQRDVELFDRFVETLRRFVVENRVTYREYNVAMQYVLDLARSGEIPLFMDVFFESTVESSTFQERERAGTIGTVEGPFYLPGAPMLERPYVMPMRPDEPGDVLFFSGTVRSSDGQPVSGAVLDLWHSDANSMYSNVPYPDDAHASVPEWNLRGRLTTDEQGAFEVKTVVPSPYTIPNAGPTGYLLEQALGRHSWRPAHLHVMLMAPDHQPLTTSLYFEGDRWLDSDVANAVKPELIVRLERHTSPEALTARGIDRPYVTASFDFTLLREEVPVLAGAR